MAWGPKQAGYRARGVAPAYGTIRTQPAASGRFIDAEDVRLQRQVVFIGSEVARKLFGNVPPVGQQVRINGMTFDVIGVQKEKVQLSNYGRPDKESVFIPYTTAGQLWNTEFLERPRVSRSSIPTLEPRATTQVIGHRSASDCGSIRRMSGRSGCSGPTRRRRSPLASCSA